MNIKKSFIAFICAIIFIVSTACTEAPPAKVDVEYTKPIDYVGTSYQPSENVKNVSVYSTLDQYQSATVKNAILWVEEGVQGFELNNALQIAQGVDTLVIISQRSKPELIEAVTGEPTREVAVEGYEPCGILITEVDNIEGKDIVGLYSSEYQFSNTQMYAFASEYDHKNAYQGDTMVTKYQDTEKYRDYLNIFNLGDLAYSVNYTTLVDFIENPTINTTENGTVYKFMHTIWMYNEVVPVNGAVSGFKSLLDMDKDSYLVSFSPDRLDGTADRVFEAGEDEDANFFYGRTFKTVRGAKADGYINALYKGFGETHSGWEIFYTDKSDKPVYQYQPIGLYCVTDSISVYGHYMPTAKLELDIKDANGVKSDWSVLIPINEWAIAWGDNYEE